MNPTEAIKPTWEDTQDFLYDNAESRTVLEFQRKKREADREGDGEMYGYYPVIYTQEHFMDRQSWIEVEIVLELRVKN